MTDSRRALLLLACVAAVYVAVVLSGPPLAFWTIDEGLKYLTVERLVETSFRDASIVYPGEDLDPTGEFFPMKPPIATRVRGRFLPDVSLVFPILSAPLYAAFSGFGLYLLPMAGALLTLWLTFRMARPFLGGSAPWVVPVLGLATPVFFYAVTFWEHNLAVLLSTAAVLLLLRRGDRIPAGTAFAAGLCLGAAVWFREECYVFAASAVLALLFTRSGARAVLGALAGTVLSLLPLVLFQWRVLEKPFGKRVEGAAEFGLFPRESGGGVLGFLRDRAETLYAWTLGLDRSVLVSLTAAIPILAGLALYLGVRRRVSPPALLAGTALYGVVCAVVFAGEPDLVFAAFFGGGLFATAPVAAVWVAGLVRRGEGPRPWAERFVIVLVALFFTLAVLVSPVKYQRGVHWGPRYLLPIFPLLTVFGAAGIRREIERGAARRLSAALLLAVVLVSCIVQIQGITALEIKKRGTARTIEALEGVGGSVVVTNVWWFPLEVAPAYRERPIFHVTDTWNYHALLDRLAERGVERFTLVASPGEDRILRDPVARVLRVTPVVHPRMGYFDLIFCECERAKGTD